MVSSAGMSVFNKLAVQALDLPISLVLIQMLFTVASIAVRPNSVHIGSMRDALRWGLSVPMLFAAMLVSSMVAMQYNSLGTIVIFRNIAPLFTLAIESMFRIPMQVTRDTIASLVTIVLGVALYHYSTLAMSAIGLAAICLNMAFAVLERLMQRHLMAQAPVDISKPGMMLLNNLFGLIPCSVLVLTYQEVPRWPSVVTHLSVGKWLLITASCVNGLAISYAVPQRCPCYSTRIFCLCFARLTSFHQTKISPKSHFAHFSSPPRCANLFRHTAVFVPPMVNVACLFRVQGLRVQQLVTATTFMVLTNVNKFVVIFFGVVALHDPLTARAAFGVLLAMGGGVWYAQARAHAPEPAKKQQVLPLSAIKL
eukprot:CAMPEP_0181217344 /NCGR_PEP_ID=MMETSP1096-20121128/27099_1 /TAXON_ID=156174 ORGANISM="Chrysochromulina ericina, Strain CCMP281" /NCGR_SAMPLE_ID=MMETSP1096 /ASSEMBLY_ACC=CAM_ASM_000453 /LENGTH=366 /DNA_ID=CAMNT_0023309465 /DNA_START=48 /DNA_END=1148 /DNA_ORIENTATION=-